MSTVENTLGALNSLPHPDDGKRSPILVLGCFTTSVVVLLLLGGSISRYLIPVAATGTAYLLYRRAPATYVSFVWWLWFLSCFIRRMVDFRSGFADSNPIVAAPFLASLVCIPALFDRAEAWRLRGSFPFVLGFVSALYGLGVGFLCIPKKILLMSALGWFAPLVFGFFIFSEFADAGRREAMMNSLQTTFRWGVLVMGVYGVIQYYLAPAWDALWMTESKMGSIGSPEPFGIRVFSTMNGPGALAFTLVAGLMLLLSQRGLMPLIAGAAGCATLLLSSVRSAWAALLLAILLLAIRDKKYFIRLTVAAVLLGVCIAGAMAIEPIRENVQNRFSSFTDMKDDTSYQDRQSGHEKMTAYAADEPFGTGLGTMDANFTGKTALGTRDSGLWEIALSLGWVGGAVYLAALGLLMWNAWRAGLSRTGTELIAACICIGLISQLLLGSVMLGVTGCTIWMFGAIAMTSSDSVVAPAEGPKDAN
jgi:hypothetical protein